VTGYNINTYIDFYVIETAILNNLLQLKYRLQYLEIDASK